MQPEATAPGAGAPQIRALRPDEAPEAARVLAAAFRGNAFYAEALGLDERAFGRYWSALAELALTDPAARVLAACEGARVAAVIVIATGGFPHPFGAVRFLLRLLAAVGARRLARYLRFVAAYEHVMRRPAAERAREACGLWLAADPEIARPGTGAVLARTAMAVMAAEGKPLITGFVDAGNRPLLAFYRRLGFSQRVVPFAGSQAVLVERQLAEAPC